MTTLAIFFSEFIASIFGVVLFSSFDDNFLHGSVAVTFIGFIIFFLFAQAALEIIKNKKMPWVRFGVAFWALSLLFVNPEAYTPEINWQKPVELVSQNIEKEQHGIFYGLLKYMNQEEGQLYRYKVEWSDGKFLIKQNDNRIFTVDPERLSSDSYKAIVDAVRPASESPTEKVTMPQGVECFSVDQQSIITTESADQSADFFNCSSLSFNGDPIFGIENWAMVTDTSLSPDKKWLMIVIESGAYDPEYVYLVNLQ